MASDSIPPLLVLTGPTASGKSDVGVELARRLDTEIISADSVQVYRHFDIGSAKPPQQLLSQVRHHMIDVVDPDEEFNVATYRDMAGAAARGLVERGRIPLVVGGSGLYIRGLAAGLHLGVRISPEVDREMDEIATREGQAGLYARMKEVDPDWAARVHPNDTFRTRRSLGVYMTCGKTATRIFAENPDKRAYNALVVALDPPRAALYRKIEKRIDAMLKAGWREEISRLREMGYNYDTKPMRSIGYRTLYNESLGLEEPETARRKIVKDTKAYARRQLTWLRGSPEAIFVNTDEGRTADEIAGLILERNEVRDFLEKRFTGRP